MAQGRRNDATIAPSWEDMIYAAAFIDADGCITVRQAYGNIRKGAAKSVSVSAYVVISQADPHGPMLVWFQERWGGSIRTLPTRKGNSQSAWEWCIASQQAYKFLDDIRPYMKIKGQRADNALLLRDLRRATGRGNAMTEEEILQRAIIKARALELNKRGI
jgi:hypothetical protein